MEEKEKAKLIGSRIKIIRVMKKCSKGRWQRRLASVRPT